MILTNRLFTRRDPDRDAKSIYIFCEGKKREYQYFRYFRRIDSRINIEVYPLENDDNNSPTGLYKIAQNSLLVSKDNPASKYEFISGDEVWFVIDTDKWGEKTTELRSLSKQHEDWNVAQSNPCFEVWLYYHLFDTKASFAWIELCQEWKTGLSTLISGGFDSKKHPIHIGRAIGNSKKLYEATDGTPLPGSTEVYRLAESIYAVCHRKIEHFVNKI